MATPAELVREFSERLEARDDDAAFALVAPDFVNHAAAPQGRDGLRRTIGVVRHDFADLEYHEDRVVAEGDLVVNEVRQVGTHVASTMPLLQGVEPRGLRVTWTFVHTWRVADGLIVEHWATRDDLGLLVQLGAWPPV